MIVNLPMPAAPPEADVGAGAPAPAEGEGEGVGAFLEALTAAAAEGSLAAVLADAEVISPGEPTEEAGATDGEEAQADPASGVPEIAVSAGPVDSARAGAVPATVTTGSTDPAAADGAHQAGLPQGACACCAPATVATQTGGSSVADVDAAPADLRAASSPIVEADHTAAVTTGAQSATTVSAAAPADTSGAMTARLVERVVDVVQRMQLTNPPQTVVIEIPDLPNARIAVTLQPAGVHLSFVGMSSGEVAPLIPQMANGLSAEGFDMAGWTSDAEEGALPGEQQPDADRDDRQPNQPEFEV